MAVTFLVPVLATSISTIVLPSIVAISVVPGSVPAIASAPLRLIPAVAAWSAVRSLPDIMATSVLASVRPRRLWLPIRVAYLSVRACVTRPGGRPGLMARGVPAPVADLLRVFRLVT